ncbi:MAG: hypothetical protein EAZ89_09780, partial [Bacteroidetes bacterium]
MGFPPLRNYSKVEYGGGTQNWDFVQDKRGLLYIANNKGLLEFDGVGWALYPMPNRTIVHSLAVDEPGKLYVGGQAEFGYFGPGPQGELIYHSLAGRVPEKYRSFEDVWEIFLCPEGVLFATAEALFLLREGQDSAATYLARHRFDGFFVLKNELYVWEAGTGLQRWSAGGLSLMPQGAYFSDIKVSSLLDAGDGGLLVVTRDEGLFMLRGESLSPWAGPLKEVLRHEGLFSAQRLSDGRYALGTIRQGLILLDAQGNLLYTLNQSFGLSNNTILSLYEDTHRNLWLGMDNGMTCLEMQSPFSYIDQRMGVSGSGYAAGVLGDELFLGTNQGVFAGKMKEGGAEWNQESFKLVPGTQGQVWCLQQEGPSLWIGHHRGAFLLNSSGISPLSQADGLWKLLPLHIDPNLAVAGAYNGLHLFRRKQPGDPWQYLHPLSGFDESSRVMEQDAEGNLWISHAYKGVYRIRLTDSGDSIRDLRFFQSADGLPSDYAINVALIRNEMVFTTSMGVYRFDAAQERFYPHEAFNTVLGSDKRIYRLIQDGQGDVWFSREGEFGYLHFRQQGLTQILEKHLLNPLHNKLLDGFESVFRASQEQVLIGTETGFIHYHLDSRQDSLPPFQVYIRQVTSLARADSVLFRGTFSIDGKILSAQPPDAYYALSHRENHLRFTFSALPGMGSQPCQYRFRLEGLENEWSEWQQEHYKEYTNLPPGTYRFHLEARDAFGRPGAPATFAFIVHPPWYLSTWARAAYVLLLLALVGGGIWLVYRRVSARHDALELAQNQTLQRKEAEFQQEARKSEAEIIRLRNEALRAEVAHKNQELASAAMHLVQKGESLQHIKQELRKVLNV